MLLIEPFFSGEDVAWPLCAVELTSPMYAAKVGLSMLFLEHFLLVLVYLPSESGKVDVILSATLWFSQPLLWFLAATLAKGLAVAGIPDRLADLTVTL